jgi:hypothetical protein
VVLSKQIPAAKYIFLRVTDPGGLKVMSTLSSGGNCLSVSNPSRVPTDCGAAP